MITNEQPYKPIQNFSKQARSTLLGINQQLKDLETTTQKAFPQIWIQNDWNYDLKKIREKVKVLSDQFPKKEKENYLVELEKLNDKYSGYLDELSKISKIEDTKIRLDGFFSQSYFVMDIFFVMDIKESKKLFDKIAKHLNSKKEKIERWDEVKNIEESTLKKSLDYYIFKIKNIIPNFPVIKELKKSLTKHEQLVNDYYDLKNSWFKTFSLYTDLEYKIPFSLQSDRTLPMIESYTQRLEKDNVFFKNLKVSFESISINNLKTFSKVEKKVAIDLYKEKINDFISNYPAFKVLSESICKNSQLIREALSEIRQLVILIENKSEKEFHFLDESMQKTLKEKRENSLNELKLLEENIVNGWNEFYMNLNRLTHQINLLAQFKSITEKISTCYLSAEEILHTNDQTLYSKNREFSNFCNLVEKSNEKLRESRIKMLEIKNNENPKFQLSASKNFNYLIQPLELKGSQEKKIGSSDFFANYIKKEKNFLAEYEIVMKLQPTNLYENLIISDIENVDEADYLMFHSGNHKTKVLDEFRKQKEKLSEELANYQQNVKDAYQALSHICDQAVININHEIEVKSPTSKPSSTSLLSGVTSMIWNSVPEEKILHGKVKSPFEK